MNRVKYSCLLLIAAVVFMAGCQESDSQLVQRARLVGSENIQLQKELEQKDKEIQSLKDRMAKMEEDYQQQLNESAESSFKLLEIVSQTSKDLEECRAENERLKAQLNQ